MRCAIMKMAKDPCQKAWAGPGGSAGEQASSTHQILLATGPEEMGREWECRRGAPSAGPAFLPEHHSGVALDARRVAMGSVRSYPREATSHGPTRSDGVMVGERIQEE